MRSWPTYLVKPVMTSSRCSVPCMRVRKKLLRWVQWALFRPIKQACKPLSLFPVGFANSHTGEVSDWNAGLAQMDESRCFCFFGVDFF